MPTSMKKILDVSSKNYNSWNCVLCQDFLLVVRFLAYMYCSYVIYTEGTGHRYLMTRLSLKVVYL
jgi:hypothetical protein